jgi:hypothetical protein
VLEMCEERVERLLTELVLRYKRVMKRRLIGLCMNKIRIKNKRRMYQQLITKRSVLTDCLVITSTLLI